MALYRQIIAGLWLLFIVYWAVSAVGAKRSDSKRSWRFEIGLRLIVLLVEGVEAFSKVWSEFVDAYFKALSNLGIGRGDLCSRLFARSSLRSSRAVTTGGRRG